MKVILYIVGTAVILSTSGCLHPWHHDDRDRERVRYHDYDHDRYDHDRYDHDYYRHR